MPPGPPARPQPADPVVEPSALVPRLAWADVVKGLSIVLVVLHHVVTKLVVPALPEGAAVATAWTDLTYALKPVRMPLFFLVGGLFAAGAVTRPPRAAVRRVVAPAYLYLVWLLVVVAVFTVERTLPTNRVTSAGELAGELLLPATGVWFLWAMAVYLVVAVATRRVPAGRLVLAAATLAGVSSSLGLEHSNRESALAHLVFFLVGARFPALVHRAAELRLPLAVGVGAYALSAVAVYRLDLPRGPVLLLLGSLGVVVGLAAGRRLAGLPWLGAGLSRLGRRTLPVYVLHLPLLGVLVHLVPAGATTAGPVAAVLPLVLTAVVVGACLALHRVLVGTGLTWLFALPRAWEQALPGAQPSSTPSSR